MSKIEFTLFAKEKIIDYRDGTIIYDKGQKIGKYNLTKDGKLKIEKLPIGTYELKETKTLNELATLKDPIEVKFEKKDDTTRVYTKDIKVTNETTKVSISKTDITGDKELEGAKLQVIDKDNKVIDEWTSTNKEHLIEGLKVGNEYTLKEEIAPEGYVISNEVKFTIKDTNEIQKVNMKDKIVSMSKVDIGGEEIEGAKIQVFDKDNNLVDEWTSTKEEHKIKNLKENEIYRLHEEIAPEGFVKATDIEFKVTTDKKTQKIEMKDMPILKNVKVIKIDSETKETIKDKFTFAIYEDQECTKLIKEVKSNKEDGTALFEKLRYGIYYIKETKAPKDYELSTRVVKVEINDKGIFVDDEQVEEKDSTIEFTFENKKIEVPKTGDESKIKLFAGAVILSLFGIAYIVIRNHNKNKQN